MSERKELRGIFFKFIDYLNYDICIVIFILFLSLSFCLNLRGREKE